MSLTMNWNAVASVVLAYLCGARPAAAQFPATVQPGDLDGRAGFTVIGDQTEEFGYTVAGIGDVNADGIDDMASGGRGVFPLPTCECPGACEATPGSVYVMFGRPDIAGDGEWDIAKLDGTIGFRIPGIHPFDAMGSVAPAGDVNGDGVDDFMVGAPSASPGVQLGGEVYVIYGRVGLGAGGSFDLTLLDGSNGFVVRGEFSFSGLGSSGSMAGLGDFNGDGVDDIALGALGGDPHGLSGAGQVYLLFGGRSIGAAGPIRVPTDFNSESGIVFNGIAPQDIAGHLVAPGGDFNGDGLSDLLISATGADPQPNARGQVYLIYGGLKVDETGVLELSALDGKNGFAINGPPPRIGESIAGVGDLNADGCDDVAISVNDTVNWAGVAFGGSDVAPNGVLCLKDLDGDSGFRAIPFGKPEPAGDVNSDGIADLMSNARVIFGSDGIGATGTIQTNELLDGQRGFFFPGLFTTGRTGIGDINADGIDDVVFGAREFVKTCVIGKVQVLFGRRMGDGDLDADIDLADFAGFQRCFGQPSDGDVPDECHPFDFDKDNDIDVTDFAAFQELFATPP